MDAPLNIINLNHQWTESHKASVSILDRGYLFGDAVYEAISFYKGKLYLGTEHLQRLERSLAEIELPNPMTLDKWQTCLINLIEKNHMHDHDGFIYLQVSRQGDISRQHVWKNNTPFFMAMAFKKPMPENLLKIKVISLNDERWQRCDIKSTSLLANTMAAKKASRQEASECLLFKNNILTEGSSSNVFIIKGQHLFTPPTDHILRGITRDKIFSIARKLNLSCSENNISMEEVLKADEVFITSTTRIIQSIKQMDEYYFPEQSVVTEKIFRAFIQSIRNHDRTLTRTH